MQMLEERRVEKLTATFISGPGVTIQNGLSAKLSDLHIWTWSDNSEWIFIEVIRPTDIFSETCPLVSALPSLHDRLKSTTPSLWNWVHLFLVLIYLHLISLKWVRVSNLEQLYSSLSFFTPRGQITGILSTTISVSSIAALVFCYHCFVLMALFLMEQSMMKDIDKDPTDAGGHRALPLTLFLLQLNNLIYFFCSYIILQAKVQRGIEGGSPLTLFLLQLNNLIYFLFFILYCRLKQL